jgi:cell division protease FtsH
MALGLTQQLPVDEKHNLSRSFLEDEIAILLGGRIAEELTAGNVTTGAGNDLERVTDLARRMVCEWGMSQSMGPLTFGKKEEQIFLGREIAQHQDYSEDTAIKIDQEVKGIVSMQYERAYAMLAEHREALTRIAEALLTLEVLDGEQVRRLAAGGTVEEIGQAQSQAASAATDDEAHARQRDRASIVPPLPPIQKPLPQE